MSYVRFSAKERNLNEEYNFDFGFDYIIPKSDLYIYGGSEGLECCGCILKDGYRPYTSRIDMIKHIKEHIDAGHAVPKGLIKTFMNEIEEYGDEVKD